MGVNRCVCHDVSFAEIIAAVRERGLSLTRVVEQTGCTTGCGSCEPYIRLALATGRAVLPPMSKPDLERWLRDTERATNTGSPSVERSGGDTTTG